MMRVIPMVLASALVIGYGVLEGLFTNRWSGADPAKEAAARIQPATIALQLGDWHGQERKLDPAQVRKGEIDGWLTREYRHGPTGTRLTVLLVCGKPGPIAAHGPEVCFGGSGYTMRRAERRPLETEGLPKPAQFWGGSFEKSASAIPDHLRIWWSWSAAGEWNAVDNPRLSFATVKALFKLYIVRPLARLDEPLDDDLCADFLKLFLVELQNKVFAELPKAGH